MRNKYRFTAVLLLTIAVCAYVLTGVYIKNENTGGKKEISVVTSFYPMYIAALNVIGDCENIHLENLSEPQTGCLHDFQMTPEDMKLLSGADVFIVNGGGMESFLTEAAEQYPKLTIIETLETDTMAEDEHELHGEEAHEEDEHEDVHVHEDGSVHTHSHENTHAWMSVAHHREQIAKIKDGLCEAIPAYAEEFKANALEYDAKLAELETRQQEILAVSAGEEFISFSEAYAYLAEDYGMEIAYTINLDEERQISAGEVADVLSAINEHGVSIIFAEKLYGEDLAKTVEKEADVSVYYLDTLVRGEYDADSYLHGMQENIHVIRRAFGMEAL